MLNSVKIMWNLVLENAPLGKFLKAARVCYCVQNIKCVSNKLIRACYDYKVFT